MVFSKAAVKAMLEKKHDCDCPTDDHPDDMRIGKIHNKIINKDTEIKKIVPFFSIVGVCLSHLDKVTMIHNRGFHQYPPSRYGAAVLEYDRPVSFHKFNDEDPVKMYEKWFKEDDRSLAYFKENGVFREDTDKQEL